jgi:hypothetical protein
MEREKWNGKKEAEKRQENQKIRNVNKRNVFAYTFLLSIN